MNKVTKYCSMIGLAAIFLFSNAVFAACSFESENLPTGVTAPDRVSDLSGQGNISCVDIIGSDGQPMREVTEVEFKRDNSTGTFTWELDEVYWDKDVNGFVTNTPDDILAFPQGNGTRCDFSFLRNNAVKGALLDIGGNIDTKDSIACTDDIVNNEEVPPPPEPDIVTTGDTCVVQLDATILDEEGNPVPIDETAFDVFTSTNLDGTRQAICSAKKADGTTAEQFECVRGCPKFIDIDALQADGNCLPIAASGGRIPLFDSDVVSTDNPLGRCTPCLTAAQAKADSDFPGFDTGLDKNGVPLKLCWQYTNRVVADDLGNTYNNTYKPHKPIRSQTTETDLFNACYQTTVTVNFFGREIVKTVTTCD